MVASVAVQLKLALVRTVMKSLPSALILCPASSPSPETNYCVFILVLLGFFFLAHSLGGFFAHRRDTNPHWALADLKCERSGVSIKDQQRPIRTQKQTLQIVSRVSKQHLFSAVQHVCDEAMV